MQFSKYSFSKTEQAVLKTLLYSDIFHFPLTKNELWRFLISPDGINKDQFNQTLVDLVNVKTHRKKNYESNGIIFDHKNIVSDEEFLGITFEDGLYCLTGREEIIQKRRTNFLEVRKKLIIAQKTAHILSFIPTIKFIGITGGVAIGNATKEDDIDFFIITQKNTLFLTRFWILAVLEVLGLRRKRHDKNPADKICVNLFLDEKDLTWAAADHNIYIAHEIMQVRPLFERESMYRQFLESNYWVKKYFPNVKKNQHVNSNKKYNYWIFRFLSIFIFFRPHEVIMRKLQTYYMQKHQTKEIISKTLLALHPKDYKTEIMEVLRSKYKKVGLLTNL